jgi:hypothetical protein
MKITVGARTRYVLCTIGNTSDDQEDNFNFDGSDSMNESTGRTETSDSKNLKRGCPTSSLAVQLKKKKQ